jgi:hypothetical protein
MWSSEQISLSELIQVRQGFRGEVAEENGISAEGDCHYRGLLRGDRSLLFVFRQKVSFSGNHR